MRRVTIFAVICFFAVSGIGLAKGPCGMGVSTLPHGKWWQTPEVAKKLNLTSEELQKLDGLYVESQRQLIDLRSSVQKEKLELEVILDQPDFDESACMKRFKKYQDAHTKLLNERFKFLIKMRELLGLDRYRKLKTEHRHGGTHRMKGQQGRQGPMKGGMIHE